jgi:hypothetical protein
MKEKEHIPKYVSMEEDHSVNSLTQWEMELKMLEDWLSSLEPEGGFHEIAMTEETFQHDLQLEKVGIEQTQE